jgi:hypothetical protein
MRNIERELRLFACWSVRNTPLQDGRMVWDLLTDKRSQTAVEVAERHVDGLATDEELDAARAAAWTVAWAGDAAERDATWIAERDATWIAERDAARDAQNAHLKQVLGALMEKS